MLLRLVILGCLLIASAARPAVRTIRDESQWNALLKKHSTETGLPVIVDFYSDSCGPCRQIAPAYKALAKEYAGKAVFVKVDVNRQHQISGRYGVRSMPTFLFFVGGKKYKEFSGAGEQQLRQFTKMSVDKADRENVELTFESMMEFYAVNDPMKAEEDVEAVLKRCAGQAKAGGKCAGGAAGELARKLKKKYGKGPKTAKRFQPSEKEEEKEKKPQERKSKPSATPSNASMSPPLTEISKDDLLAELARRKTLEDEAAYESEEEDDDEAGPPPAAYKPSDFPERVVIVGSGPAGLSAAVYAGRAGLRPVVVAPPLGGQLQGKGVEVENYPGLFNVTGPDVVALMRAQAVEFGATFEGSTVTAVDSTQRPIKVTLDTGSHIMTHTVIVATGADSVWLDVPGEYEHRGAGVSSCATCDGHLFRGMDVVVVGGGDSAMEDALVLSRTSENVVVVVRRGELRASKVLADRAMEKENIRFIWNHTVEEIKGGIMTVEVEGEGEDDEPKREVKSVVIKEVTSGSTQEIPCNAVFVAIGHSPNTDFLSGQVALNPKHKGYLQVEGMSSVTSVEGIFAAGDSADANYRQAITSAGSGAMAALDVERYLSEHGLGNEEEEFERQMLAEMMSESGSEGGGGGYNAYEDGDVGKGRKEDSKVEKKKKEAKKEEAGEESKNDSDDEERIEL